MIDVLWVSWHKEDVLARGYADQGFLEDLLAGDVWSPPLRYEFEHHEVHDDFGERFSDGAVVILPARHHTSEEDVDRFLANLDQMAWSLVILSGDEDWEFPWQRVEETETRKVWVMQPRPEHGHLSGLIPGGYYPWVRPNLVKHNDRPYDFFFAGQVTHERRRECVRYLHKMKRRTNGIIIETDGYLQGIPRADYMNTLCQSKFIPCPSGPMTVDTARPLEAMEAGCVPVVDTVTPRGEDYDYWRLVFGEHPLPTIRRWLEFPQFIQKHGGDYQHMSNKVFAWWQGWKRYITMKLHNNLETLGANDYPSEESITVIVTTSPTPIHPSLDHIRIVIESIRERLPTAEILIACDGVREEDAHLREAYETYLRDLLWAANTEWHNVLPIVMDEFLHQANTVKKVLWHVRTPYVLFVEHDTPLEGDIPFEQMTYLMNNLDREVNSIRFHFDVELHPEHEPLHFGEVETYFNVPLRRIRVWWARPFLIRTQVFRDQLAEKFTDESRSFIEDKLYGHLHCDWNDYGEAGWDNWKIWTYMPEGNIKRSGHLDSRGAHPKHEQVFG